MTENQRYVKPIGLASEDSFVFKVLKVYMPDRQAMLARLRVVLGLPKILSDGNNDDLLSDAG